MRTGGVDQARMGRRKRSPKPKPKKLKPSLTQQNTQSSSHGSSQAVLAAPGDQTVQQGSGSDTQDGVKEGLVEVVREGQNEAEIEQAMNEEMEKSTEV
jgi:hypothetical protein